MASPRGVRSFEDVRALCADLPGVEVSTSYGTPALKVKGKLLLRMHGKLPALVIPTTFDDRDHLLREWPKEFFFTEHYRGYPTVLAHMATVNRKRLAQLLRDGCLRLASAKR